MATTTQPPNGTATRPRMQRPASGRVLAGVAAALAERTTTAPWLIRLGFVVTAFIGGLGVIAYLTGWFLIPAEEATESPAEAWVIALGTPGRRAGALLIAVGLLILLGGIAPVGLILAAVLLITGGLLIKDGRPNREGESA